MSIKNLFSKKRVYFVLLFFVLVYFANQVNFSALVGAENQFFTLFQFFGPTAGAFLGPIFGIVAVLFSQIADFIIKGKEWELVSLLRFLPMLFAVYYFSRGGIKNKVAKVLIPLVCITLFILHPVGRQAWVFSLYWLIPVLAVIVPERWPGQLFFRSFGATFTAHAIGGAIWIYTVPMTAGQWFGLIPVVAYERFLFGMGIAGSFLFFNTVLDYLVEKFHLKVPSTVLFLDQRYALLKRRDVAE